MNFITILIFAILIALAIEYIVQRKKGSNKARIPVSSQQARNRLCDIQRVIKKVKTARQRYIQRRKNAKKSRALAAQQAENRLDEIQRSIEKAQAARLQYEQLGELRWLDIQIAEAFLFYTSITWQKNYRQPTGIPRTEYDRHTPGDERHRQAIPYYSTNERDYSILERDVMARSLYHLFLQILAAKGLDETSATLEQKCRAWLKAQTDRRSRRSSK